MSADEGSQLEFDRDGQNLIEGPDHSTLAKGFSCDFLHVFSDTLTMTISAAICVGLDSA